MKTTVFLKATIGEIILFSNQVLEIFDAQSITSSVSNNLSRAATNDFYYLLIS